MGKFFDVELKRFADSYLKAISPVGFEERGQRVWLDYMKMYSDKTFTDNYGTAVAVIKGSTDFKVVIEAHADEISWSVKYINENGTINVIRNGGSDQQVAPSKKVKILTLDGKEINGVFGWPAIHTRSKSKVSPETNNIFIDVGADSKKEVLNMGVNIGDVVVYDETPSILNNRYILGKALDNKIGGIAISQVARKIKTSAEELPFTLYIVNSVQEEIGLMGAKMITETIKPDCVIVTDVTHHTDTDMIDKKVEGDVMCGKGPVVMVAPAVQKNLLRHVIDTAYNNGIDIQRTTTSGSTGTDTDSFAYSNGGVPSCLISFPLKYMHTTVEMVDMIDIEMVTELIYRSVIGIKSNQDFKVV